MAGFNIVWRSSLNDDDIPEVSSPSFDSYDSYHEDNPEHLTPYAYDYQYLCVEELFEQVRENHEYVCNALLQSVALNEDAYYPLKNGDTIELSYHYGYDDDLFPKEGFTTMVKACHESDPDALYMYCLFEFGNEEDIYVKPVESGAAYFKSWCGHYFTEEEIEILNAGDELYLPELMTYEDNYVMGVTIRYNPTHRLITYHYGKPTDKNSKEGKTAELWYKFQEYCQIKGIYFNLKNGNQTNYRVMSDFLAFLLTDEGREQLAICQEAGIDWKLLKKLPDEQAQAYYKPPVNNTPDDSDDSDSSDSILDSAIFDEYGMPIAYDDYSGM